MTIQMVLFETIFQCSLSWPPISDPSASAVRNTTSGLNLKSSTSTLVREQVNETIRAFAFPLH